MLLHARNARMHPGQRQAGATLFIALVFLVLLTIVGISMFTSTTAEEKLARNYSDFNIAFQAAEAALRDAEIRVAGTWVYYGNSGASLRPINGNNFATDCANGLCAKGFAASLDWLDPDDSNFATKTVEIGSCPGTGVGCDANNQSNTSCSPSGTCSPRILGVSNQPHYVMESIDYNPPGTSLVDLSDIAAFRISSIGFGRSGTDTRAMVQSVYIRY